MAYSAIAVANAFIEKAKDRGIDDISPMKLQKLVFFAHAWMLAVADEPLITDPVIAWQFGPVINSIYHEFKSFGSNTITTPGTEFEYSEDENGPDFGYVIPNVNKNDKNSNRIIDAILEVYGNKTAIYLSNLTHENGSAWCETRQDHNDGNVRNFVIDNEIIKSTTKKQLGL